MTEGIMSLLKKKYKNRAIRQEEDKGYIAICIPQTGASVHPLAYTSVMALSLPKGWGRILTTIDSEPIDRSRNEMVAAALNMERVKYILMVEKDVKIHPGTLVEVLSIDADIISIPVFGEREPHHPNVYANPADRFLDFYKFGEHDKEVRAVDIFATDPGCVLVKRKVFLDNRMEPFFKYNDDYFRTDMFNFTSRANQLGHSVVATTKLTAERVSTRLIGFGDFNTSQEVEKLRKDPDKVLDLKDRIRKGTQETDT